VDAGPAKKGVLEVTFASGGVWRGFVPQKPFGKAKSFLMLGHGAGTESAPPVAPSASEHPAVGRFRCTEALPVFVRPVSDTAKRIRVGEVPANTFVTLSGAVEGFRPLSTNAHPEISLKPGFELVVEELRTNTCSPVPVM
jgi:hypothetical protein